MPTDGDERQRSPHPYARRGRHIVRSEESSNYETHQTPTLSSESGTEADDERSTQFLKALPPPLLRPAKGLKGDQDGAPDGSPTPLLTPSQLDKQGRRLSEGYFDYQKPLVKLLQPEEDELQAARRLFEKRRRAERIRRVSEGALLAVIGLIIISAPPVLSSLWTWHRELLSQVAAVAFLIVAYPLRIVIFRPSEDIHRPRWRRFRVPASFDPASILYPTFVPVLVALCLLPQYPALLLPNLILGLASLPPRLFPPLTRLKDLNTLHWVVSIVPLISSETSLSLTSYGGQLHFQSSELLTLLYPLHQVLLPSLHYLTTTSLLPAEKHLLSASLINLLLFANSAQTSILRALLWVGGVWVLVLCTHVARWNVALARVPRWRFRRCGTNSSSSSSVHRTTPLAVLKKWIHPLARHQNEESDTDDNAPIRLTRSRQPKKPKLGLNTSFEGLDLQEPKSAAEPKPQADRDPALDDIEFSRKRRHTIASVDIPSSFLGASPSAAAQRRQRRLRDWHLNLTPEGAFVYKWAYAIYIYVCILFVILIPVRQTISARALDSAEPVLWALDYFLSDIPTVYEALSSRVNRIAYQDEILQNLSIKDFDVTGIQIAIGAANTRLLIVAYWLAVLCVGLFTVIRLSPFIEVDTRRKVFHAVMVTMLLPSIFVDPCFCSLALGIVLAIFLILEVIRAGQVPPLGIAIGRFVAPYVDGRDLRGPMVVSHIFLLIGCAIPLWLSLAGMGRTTTGRWPGWETEDGSREVAMVAGVVCVGMGDAAASLIGRRFGRCKWPWIGGKSLEGSGAFAVAVTVGLLLAKCWVLFGGWHDISSHRQMSLGLEFWTLEVMKMFVCGCGASFMEAVLTGANDNVVVPVALWLLVKSLGV